jgi:hypothetical protein
MGWGNPFKAVERAIHDVVHVVEQAVDVIVTVLDAVVKYTVGVITNPRSLLQHPEQAIALAAAIFFAPETGGLSLIEYAEYSAMMNTILVISTYAETVMYYASILAVQSGGISAGVSKMEENGWVDDKTAAVATVVANLATLAYASSLASSPFSAIARAGDAMLAAGVNPATVYSIMNGASYLATSSIYMSLGENAYSLYSDYVNSQKLEDSYKQAQAQFEAWKKSFTDKTEQSTHEMNMYISGMYYRMFAGQDLFNIALPSHFRYDPTNVQEQCYGIFHGKANEKYDMFTSRVMYPDKNFDMAGGSGYMRNAMGGTMVQLGQY